MLAFSHLRNVICFLIVHHFTKSSIFWLMVWFFHFLFTAKSDVRVHGGKREWRVDERVCTTSTKSTSVFIWCFPSVPLSTCGYECQYLIAASLSILILVRYWYRTITKPASHLLVQSSLCSILSLFIGYSITPFLIHFPDCSSKQTVPLPLLKTDWQQIAFTFSQQWD